MARAVAGIVAVFLLATLGWIALGASVSLRINEFDQALRRKVGQLWGMPLDQRSPLAQVGVERLVATTEASPDGRETGRVARECTTAKPAPLVASDVEVDRTSTSAARACCGTRRAASAWPASTGSRRQRAAPSGSSSRSGFPPPMPSTTRSRSRWTASACRSRGKAPAA